MNKTNFNFAGLQKPFNDYKRSLFTVIPVPYEKTTSFVRGTKKGPEAILRASQEIELYDYETKQNISEHGISTQKSITADSPEQIIKNTKTITEKVLYDNKIPVILGGEHTISIGPIFAAKDKYHNLSVLHFDAHLDMRNLFDNNKYSHACVMRRVREKVENTVHVGIRSLCEEEYEYAKVNNLPIFFEKKYKLDEIITRLTRNVYVTIDLDVLDPSIMPSVGNPEPGGAGWYDILKIMRTVANKKNIIGFDIVELSPIKNIEHPNVTAAKLAYKIMNYIYSAKVKPTQQ